MRALNPAVLALLIPIVAIVAGAAIAIVKAWIRHRERMAMIEHGMDPDDPLLEEELREDRR